MFWNKHSWIHLWCFTLIAFGPSIWVNLNDNIPINFYPLNQNCMQNCKQRACWLSSVGEFQGNRWNSEFNYQEQTVLKKIEIIFRNSTTFCTLFLNLWFTTLKLHYTKDHSSKHESICFRSHSCSDSNVGVSVQGHLCKWTRSCYLDDKPVKFDHVRDFI